MNKIILLIALFLIQGQQLTGQEASKGCHCDLTASYCDMGCCCDTDCSSVIPSSCFLARSSQFCINSSYYFKIDSSLTPNPSLSDCYYYNQSDYLQEQVNISTKQIYSIVQQTTHDLPLQNTSPSMDRGYKIGSPMSFDAKSVFYFIDANGNCETSSSPTAYPQQIRYRVDTDIICTGSSNSINLFTNILGKSIPSFYSSTSPAFQIPQQGGSFNQVTIYFFVARYGSTKIDYIQNVNVVTSAGNPNVRKLSLRFIDPQTDVEQEQDSPSFFPQIPYDIFYPIHEIAYSFW